MKEGYKKVVDEINDTCDCKGGYCFWRKIVSYQRMDMRMLVQLECIEKYKYDRSSEEGKDVGSSKAAMEWVDRGYAKVFADLYIDFENDIFSINELYARVRRRVDNKIG